MSISNPANTDSGANPIGYSDQVLAANRLKLRIAQAVYQNWLSTQGIIDPEAQISFDSHLGYVGKIGKQRRDARIAAAKGVLEQLTETERQDPRYEVLREMYNVSDVLPRELVIEINRAVGQISVSSANLDARVGHGSHDRYIQ